MTFTGAYISKMNGGLGGGETADRVAVMVMGAKPGNKLEPYKAYELLQIEDAESLGITPATDKANKELVHYHLSEVFRLSPETRIHLITVPRETKAADLQDLPELMAALRSIEGLNTIGVAELTAGDGIAEDVQGLQLLIDELAKDYIYIDAVLTEGKGAYLGDGIAGMPNLRGLDSENVAVICCQDIAVAERDKAYENHASVGSAMGMLMVRAIHENLGSVDIETKPRNRKAEQDYTLTDTKQGKWLDAGLSNGISFDSMSAADQKKLDELGYIYAGAFAGYGGYFLSGSHTCTKADNDYCLIERNAIWNKAARIIRYTLLPRIRSKVQADPATGYIKNTTITDWDGRVRKNLEQMTAAGNIAGFDIYINPNQPAVSTKPFGIKVQLVADGIVHEFEVDLGFTKSI